MNLSRGAERDIIYHPKSFCQIILSRKLRFFAKKTAQRASAYASVYERVCSVRVQAFFENFLDGDGGVQTAGAWRLHGNYGNCEIYERGMGAPRDTPRVCCAVGRWGAGGQIYRRGMQAT